MKLIESVGFYVQMKIKILSINVTITDLAVQYIVPEIIVINNIINFKTVLSL